MRPPLLLVALLLTACGQQQAQLTTEPPPAADPADLAGHGADRPHADTVLYAGQQADLSLPTGTLRITAWGPSTVETTPFAPRRAGELRDYVATFRIEATVLTGTVALRPADLRLLAIADQVDGGAVTTLAGSATTLLAKTLTAGQHWTGTWSAPFTEGHGELLLSPGGAARPAALWDFRVEA